LTTNLPFLSFEKIENDIKEEILCSFKTFFHTRNYILGKHLQIFERNYAAFNKTTHCLGVSNGLDALFLALKALNIGQDDEVIIPSNTFIASALAVTHCGATPIFVEPDKLTYNLAPANIITAITSKTKAIMPVHLYGQACEMEAIMAIAKQYQLYVIEDNAQSQGASWQGQLTGSFGDINATSFYPGKNLGALGDAGAITTNNAGYAQKISALRNYGSTQKYYNEVIGYNKRLDECQAVFLNIKLKYLAQWNKERQQIANWYNDYLQTAPEIVLPQIAKGATSVYHLYVIRTFERNALKSYLESQGIQTLIHYPIPPHLQKCYQSLGYKKGDFPIAEEMADTCLSLPIYPGLKKLDIKFITSKIKAFYGR